MDFNSIDWNALWLAESASSVWNKTSQKELWNKRADSFSRRINRVTSGQDKLDKDDYIYKMLERVEVKPGWSLLDIGCGPGTICLPLASKAGSVTALDISSEMLKNLRATAQANNLNNIRYINSSWQEAGEDNLVEEHDVVVASRSMMQGDMRQAMSLIIKCARQAAYLTFPVVHLPFDWEVYQAIGRAGKKHPPYIYIYNLLYQMGIQANVEILHSKVKIQIPSAEAAIQDLEWRTEPFSEVEKDKIRQFVARRFADQQGKEVFTHEGYSKWALIWWRNYH